MISLQISTLSLVIETNLNEKFKKLLFTLFDLMWFWICAGSLPFYSSHQSPCDIPQQTFRLQCIHLSTSKNSWGNPWKIKRWKEIFSNYKSSVTANIAIPKQSRVAVYLTLHCSSVKFERLWISFRFSVVSSLQRTNPSITIFFHSELFSCFSRYSSAASISMSSSLMRLSFLKISSSYF